MYAVYCIYMLIWTRRSHTCFTDFLWKVCSDYITGFAFQISVGRGLLHILTASAGDSTDKMTQVSGFPPAVLHFAFWGCLDQKLWWELKPLKGFLFSRGVLALMDTPCFKTMKTVPSDLIANGERLPWCWYQLETPMMTPRQVKDHREYFSKYVNILTRVTGSHWQKSACVWIVESCYAPCLSWRQGNSLSLPWLLTLFHDVGQSGAPPFR